MATIIGAFLLLFLIILLLPVFLVKEVTGKYDWDKIKKLYKMWFTIGE